MKKRQSNAGFILIELIISMAVVAIIATVTYAKSLDKKNLQEAQIIGNKIVQYVTDWSIHNTPSTKYPDIFDSILDEKVELSPKTSQFSVIVSIKKNKPVYFLIKSIENRIKERIHSYIEDTFGNFIRVDYDSDTNIYDPKKHKFTFNFKKTQGGDGKTNCIYYRLQNTDGGRNYETPILTSNDRSDLVTFEYYVFNEVSTNNSKQYPPQDGETLNYKNFIRWVREERKADMIDKAFAKSPQDYFGKERYKYIPETGKVKIYLPNRYQSTNSNVGFIACGAKNLKRVSS